MEARRMVHLCMAGGAFHARVLAARLNAEGILAQVRGDAAGPYPLATEVEVWVPEEELAAAREVLLFDDLAAPTAGWSRRPIRGRRALGLLALLVLASMAAVAIAHLLDAAR